MTIGNLRGQCPLDSLKWTRIPIRALSSRGREYTRWVPSGMPHFGKYKHLLDSVFYLYRSEKDAKDGTNTGGTGFVVGLRSTRWPDKAFHMYGVSNWHNTNDLGFSVVRVNRRDGGFEVFDHDPIEWAFNPGPDGYDISAIYLDGVLAPADHKVTVIGEEAFLTDDMIREIDVGAGEDAFMVGRFVDYDGVEVNAPSLRFGNISIMSASVLQENGCRRPSHVLDMHSRGGYSGSPVFIYRNAGSAFAEPGTISDGHMIRLLGIHWGQFPERWELKQAKKKTNKESALITDGQYVKGLSGMTCVCPASGIMEVLNLPENVKRRKDKETEWAEKFNFDDLPVAEAATSAADLPEGVPAAADQADFNRLLGAAVKPPKSSD